jgi:hypothetical protein
MTGVNASIKPWPNKILGNQSEVPTATAAISVALTEPDITVSTTPMAVWATWARITGMAKNNNVRASRKYFSKPAPLALLDVRKENIKLMINDDFQRLLFAASFSGIV